MILKNLLPYMDYHSITDNTSETFLDEITKKYRVENGKVVENDC